MGNTAELHGRPAGWRLLQLRAGQQVGRPQQRGVGRQPWEQQVGPLEAAAGQGWAEGRAGVQANLISRRHVPATLVLAVSAALRNSPVDVASPLQPLLHLKPTLLCACCHGGCWGAPDLPVGWGWLSRHHSGVWPQACLTAGHSTSHLCLHPPRPTVLGLSAGTVAPLQKVPSSAQPLEEDF